MRIKQSTLSELKQYIASKGKQNGISSEQYLKLTQKKENGTKEAIRTFLRAKRSQQR